MKYSLSNEHMGTLNITIVQKYMYISSFITDVVIELVDDGVIELSFLDVKADNISINSTIDTNIQLTFPHDFQTNSLVVSHEGALYISNGTFDRLVTAYDYHFCTLSLINVNADFVDVSSDIVSIIKSEIKYFINQDIHSVNSIFDGNVKYRNRELISMGTFSLHANYIVRSNNTEFNVFPDEIAFYFLTLIDEFV